MSIWMRRGAVCAAIAGLMATFVCAASGPSGGPQDPDEKAKAQEIYNSFRTSLRAKRGRLDAQAKELKAAFNRGREEATKAATAEVKKLTEIMTALPSNVVNEALRQAPRGVGSLRSVRDVPNPGPPIQPGTGGVRTPEQVSMLEVRIGGAGEDDFLPVYFLELGVQRQRPVARVTFGRAHTMMLPDGRTGTFGPGDGWGTGFMVSRTLFLTNNHVLPSKDFARRVRAWFNFQIDQNGVGTSVDAFEFDPDSFFHTNVGLDYTLVRVKPKTASSGPGAPAPPGPASPLVYAGDIWGAVLINTSPDYFPTKPVNVIQHPNGRFKEIAIQHNDLTSIHDNVIRYRADTEPGSSGSPLFDNFWQLIGLHHAAGEEQDGQYINNEGIRIDRIVEDLRSTHGGTDAGRAILGELGL